MHLLVVARTVSEKVTRALRRADTTDVTLTPDANDLEFALYS